MHLPLIFLFSLMVLQKVSFRLKRVFIRDTPFLFAIVGEALHQMILEAGEVNLITRFKLARRAATTTHLQFADDTLLFCAVEEVPIKNVIAILDAMKQC